MKKIVLLALVAALSAGVAALAQEAAPAVNNGAPEIVLSVSKGDIAFPHQKHQKALNDCNLCHKMYPKEKGVIARLKDAGKLEPKSVMKACIGCHRDRLEGKLSAGPTSCAKCHGTAP